MEEAAYSMNKVVFTKGRTGMTFSEMIQGENGLLVKLRLENNFDEKIYREIKNYLTVHSEEWKKKGVMPIKDAVAVFDLVDSLSGGCIYWNDDVKNRVEYALMEVQDIIHKLEL